MILCKFFFFSHLWHFLCLVQVFNNSPDETAYFRMILNRENVANSVVMIQPSLISYSFHSTPEPALLDVSAIAADRILLLDSYFTIVVFHGSSIAQWRKAGYHNQPDHAVYFRSCIHNQHDSIFTSLWSTSTILADVCPVATSASRWCKCNSEREISGAPFGYLWSTWLAGQ